MSEDRSSQNHARIASWGKSLAIRLPADVVDALELKEGDELHFDILGPNEFAVTVSRARETYGPAEPLGTFIVRTFQPGFDDVADLIDNLRSAPDRPLPEFD